MIICGLCGGAALLIGGLAALFFLLIKPKFIDTAATITSNENGKNSGNNAASENSGEEEELFECKVTLLDVDSIHMSGDAAGFDAVDSLAVKAVSSGEEFSPESTGDGYVFRLPKGSYEIVVGDDSYKLGSNSVEIIDTAVTKELFVTGANDIDGYKVVVFWNDSSVRIESDIFIYNEQTGFAAL